MPIADPRYFLILLPTLGLFYALRAGNQRMVLVLAVSYLYYLTFPVWFLPILVGITVFTYFAGLVIQRYRETRLRWPVVGVAVVLGLSPMVIFKALSVLPPAPLIYPVGLSFYTFTSLAYLVDVALDVVDAERSPLRVGLASAFFPVLTLGPLLRTSYLSRLDFKAVRLDRQRLVRGLAEILMGMALKVGFADVLGRYTDAVYTHLSTSPGIEQFTGSVVEAFQVYADWQAYSLIAIGSARLFGIDFPFSFLQPYLSTNIGEFWRRWNVPFINWFRDYVFTPVRLQFGARSLLAIPVATLVTFLVLGMWHVRGGWEYVAYGAMNGLLVIYSQATLATRDRIWRALRVPASVVAPIRVVITFLVVVMTIPFARASSLTEALHIYAGWFSPRMLETLTLAMPHVNLLVVVPLILVLIAADVVALMRRKQRLQAIPLWLSAPVYCACTAIILWHVASGAPTNPFVYFRF